MELETSLRSHTELRPAFGYGALEREAPAVGRARRERIVELLGAALDVELSALARTKRCYFAAIEAKDHRGREVLLEQAAVQAVHTDELAERIAELGGAPDFTASHDEPTRLREPEGRFGAATHAFREALVDELEAKASGLRAHGQLLAALGDADARAREILVGIVEREEEHARVIERLLSSLPRAR